MRLALAFALLLTAVCALPFAPARAANSIPAIQLIGPGGAESQLVALVQHARARVLVEAFALSDPALIAALQGAAQRGVDVRVMLDPQGLNSSYTLGVLQAAHVRTRAPSPAFAVTHMNAIVVDASAVAVATAAFTAGALGPNGAGYTAIDGDRYDVLQAASVFYDDWLRRPVSSFGHNLVVLPDNASRLAALIDGSAHRLELYSSYLSDPGILSSLHLARARGVVVRILTPRSSSNAGLLPLVAPHSQVRFRDDGGGTALVIDRRLVLVGSMDLSGYTLSAHREMGVVLAGQAIAKLVDGSFFAEFSRGAALALPHLSKPSKGPKTKPQPRHTIVTVGSLRVSADVSGVVRSGGEGVIALTTAPHAQVTITITYPAGSAPAAAAAAAHGQADAHGAFVYRWILAGTIKPGTARVSISVRSHGAAATLTAGFIVPKS